jgi:hypothetical protein
VTRLCRWAAGLPDSELARRLLRVQEPGDEDDEREKAVQPVDPVALLLGVPEEGELCDRQDEEADREADLRPVPSVRDERTDDDRKLADVDDE